MIINIIVFNKDDKKSVNRNKRLICNKKLYKLMTAYQIY